ncbi:AraC family transcriptional regulator [Clostridium sp. Marseille-P2415]|uniref:AraC family transcriptional regulator n=1 Tax=Clostridium sp. Marseille-P2415 TaxID=1805471 RepID=UPI0009885995|nr:AraC family transcriptional regulator [Clostridium sp. Marseille-P2415]
MNIIEYENYQEKREQDPSGFPYLTYPCTIPLDFNKVPLHWHDEMEFIYIKKGTGLVSVDFVPYEVHAGDIVIVCPGKLHTIEQWKQESMEYENIIFHLNLLGSRQPDICWENYLSPISRNQRNLPVLIRPGLPYYGGIASCLDHIDQVRQLFPEAYELLIKGKLFELFFLLWENQAAFPASAPSRPPKILERTRQILKYMEQHYSESLSIKEMSVACGMSQSHFMKFFKQTMGMPFTAYLNDYRLTMASRLLLSSDDSILTIAGDTGFNNLSYFNRIFKEKFGMTPREFRRHMDIPPCR